MTDLPAALNALPPRSVRTRALGNIVCLMLLLGLVDATAGGPFAFAQNIQFTPSARLPHCPSRRHRHCYLKSQKIRHGAAYLLHQRQPILDLVESTLRQHADDFYRNRCADGHRECCLDGTVGW